MSVKLDKIVKYFRRTIFFWLLSVFFVGIYLYLGAFYVENKQFNSPDESANYYFLQALIESGKIPVLQGVGMSDVVHPRSILVWQGSLVPISFPGLIYVLAPFYFLAGLWGVWLFYALLSVFLMYLFWRWLRRENLPPVLWFLVLAQPALWYYLLHPLFSNVLSFLLGFCALFLLSEKHQWAKKISIFVIILALWVRPFDVIYLGPILMVFSIYYRVAWKDAVKYFLAVTIGSLSLFFLSNYLVYGKIYLFGYNLPNPSIGLNEGGIDYWRHIKLFLKNSWYFLAQLFWPYFALAVAGLISYGLAWRRAPRIYHFLLFSLLFGGGALVLFYGFADLNDHVVKNNISIGGAFVRYWLPVYCLLVFLIAYFVDSIRRLGYKYFSASIIISLSIFSVYAVWCRNNDSLMQERQNLLVGIQEKDLLQKIIPEGAIVVLDREDKYFFPGRPVIHLSEFRDDYTLIGIKSLLEDGHLLYYYGFTLFELDWNYLHAKKLFPLNLDLKFLHNNAEKSLYQFVLYE